MTHDLITDAVGEIDTAREATTDPEARSRLEVLGDQLESQADRETTPALGALDRIQVKLRKIERQTDDTAVSEAINRAREDILSFLATLDDRGMKQHGWSQNETNDSA